MNGLWEGVRLVWKRLTSSRVAWMALPAGIAQLWLAIAGRDIAPELNAIFSAIWALLAVFLSANNPTDSEHF